MAATSITCPNPGRIDTPWRTPTCTAGSTAFFSSVLDLPSGPFARPEPGARTREPGGPGLQEGAVRPGHRRPWPRTPFGDWHPDQEPGTIQPRVGLTRSRRSRARLRQRLCGRHSRTQGGRRAGRTIAARTMKFGLRALCPANSVSHVWTHTESQHARRSRGIAWPWTAARGRLDGQRFSGSMPNF